MRMRAFSSALLVAVVMTMAAAPAAFAADTVLTAGGALYAVAKGSDDNAIHLSRRTGEEKTTLVVPATVDDARESGVQLEYDRVADKVYVAWIRGTSEIQIASLDKSGEWSQPLVVTTTDSAQTIGELRLALTRATDEEANEATLVHAVWWQKSGSLAPKYALVAFGKSEHLSTEVADLEELAALRSVSSNGVESMGLALFPPLAIAAQRDSVDVVFGSDRSTALSRIILQPRAQARVWRPGKGPSSGLPPAHLVSLSTTPIQAYLGRDRLILYTQEGEFRFVVLTNGEWGPVRTIQTDDKVTREQILGGLRRLGGE